MTLIVGCATSDIGFLVADTLLGFAFALKGHEGPVNGQFHALKVQILGAHVAVAFAGDVEASVEMICTLSAALEADPAIDPRERLFGLYNDLASTKPNLRSPDCEFLVLQVTLEGPSLAKITREGVLHCSRAYIGDAAEYALLKTAQRPHAAPTIQQVQQPDGSFISAPLTVSDGEREFAEISAAMETLTQRRRSSSVGAIAGGVTRVVDARLSGELEYLQTVEASWDPWEGESGFSVLASNSGTRGVGIYFRSGKIGFLFVVGDRTPCHKAHAETIQQFIDLARVGFGLNLNGGTWGP